MSHTQWLRLGSLISPVSGRAGGSTTVPVYSVTKHRGFVPSLEYFNKQIFGRDLASYKLVTKGQFAYATIHLDEGSIGRAPEDALVSPMYTVFEADQSQVDPDYLILVLKSPLALSRYQTLGRGTAERRKSISLEALGALQIPLPPLSEQRRIAAILDEVNRLEGLRERSIALLTQAVDSAYSSLLATFEPPELVELENLLRIPLRNGISPSRTGLVSGRVLTLSAVTGNSFKPEKSHESTFAGEHPPDKLVRFGDLLICRGNGNRSLVGKAQLVDVDTPATAFPDTMIAARFDDSKINSTFARVAWNSPATRVQIDQIASTTNGTYKVNQKNLNRIRLPVVPLRDQLAFAAATKELERLMRIADQSLETIKELRSSVEIQVFPNF